MIVTDNNIYDIEIPEGVITIAYSRELLPLTLEEQIFLKEYNILTISEGGGDYQLEMDLFNGVFILKPHFFYKREDCGGCFKTEDFVDDYGGKVIENLYDIIEYENCTISRMDSEGRWD